MTTTSEILPDKVRQARALIPNNGIGADMRTLLAQIVSGQSDDPIGDLTAVIDGLAKLPEWEWSRTAHRLLQQSWVRRA